MAAVSGALLMPREKGSIRSGGARLQIPNVRRVPVSGGINWSFAASAILVYNGTRYPIAGRIDAIADEDGTTTLAIGQSYYVIYVRTDAPTVLRACRQEHWAATYGAADCIGLAYVLDQHDIYVYPPIQLIHGCTSSGTFGVHYDANSTLDGICVSAGSATLADEITSVSFLAQTVPIPGGVAGTFTITCDAGGTLHGHAGSIPPVDGSGLVATVTVANRPAERFLPVTDTITPIPATACYLCDASRNPIDPTDVLGPMVTVVHPSTVDDSWTTAGSVGGAYASLGTPASPNTDEGSPSHFPQPSGVRTDDFPALASSPAWANPLTYLGLSIFASDHTQDEVIETIPAPNEATLTGVLRVAQVEGLIDTCVSRLPNNSGGFADGRGFGGATRRAFSYAGFASFGQRMRNAANTIIFTSFTVGAEIGPTVRIVRNSCWCKGAIFCADLTTGDTGQYTSASQPTGTALSVGTGERLAPQPYGLAMVDTSADSSHAGPSVTAVYTPPASGIVHASITVRLNACGPHGILQLCDFRHVGSGTFHLFELDVADNTGALSATLTYGDSSFQSFSGVGSIGVAAIHQIDMIVDRSGAQPVFTLKVDGTATLRHTDTTPQTDPNCALLPETWAQNPVRGDAGSTASVNYGALSITATAS